jgi:hypothetical protein
LPIDSSQYSFKEGKTHYRDVLHSLGPPLSISALPGGFVFLYEHLDTLETQISLRLDATLVKWFKFTKAGSKVKRQELLFTFDQNGNLFSQGFQRRTENLGSGASIQILTKSDSLIEAINYHEVSDPHRWGRLMLRPLTQTLNTAQSLETGEAGLEQVGTTHTVGQTTLELRK